MASEVKGSVIPLSETISVAEAEKAAKQLLEEVGKQQEYLRELHGYRDETRALSKLVTGLPDVVAYNIMVPFGKAAFFPGRLIHTNELLVLLGEGYYSERSAKQTVGILERRIEYLKSKIVNVESHIADLEAEASFAGNTAAEAKAGVVEIREQILEAADKTFDQRSKSAITGELDPARNKSHSEGSHSASLSHRSMDEDEEHGRIMARIEALEAAEEAAGPTSDEEEMSDEEELISDDDIDDAESITKSKSYLSKEQKATLIEKLNRSEAEDYDGEGSDGENSGTEEYDIEEEDEEDRINRNMGDDSERRDLGTQADGSKKPPRPLSRFGREVQSVKDRVRSELAQRPIASQDREALEKMIPSIAGEDASCSGLEIPDMQRQNELQKLKDWRSQEFTKQGFVLGRVAEKRTLGEPKSDQEEVQKMAKPIARQTQAFTGRVTEHISRPAFPSHMETVAEQRPGTTVRSDARKAEERTTRPSGENEQGEEPPAKPVSRFRQMRQSGGR